MAIQSLSTARNQSQRDITLTIAGRGPEHTRLVQLSEALNIRESVHFTGHLSPREMPKVYADADAFIFPSIREFGGAVALEAMASGLPCIVANHGGLREYLTDECGWKIQPKSRTFLQEQMTRAICELDSRPELYNHMSHSAIHRAKQYTWQAKVTDLLGIIQRCITEKQSVRQDDPASNHSSPLGDPEVVSG